MPGTAILGAQWGDEGKGKITDMLASESDIVARFSGGDNAGHTVMVGEETFKLHLVPSGILYSNVLCVLGAGMVVNPRSLLKELEELAERGIDISPRRLRLDGKAHLIFPYHIALDGASESKLGSSAIGTTRRGIGPAYMDKAARRGIRVWDMLDIPRFAGRLRSEAQAKNIWLERVYGEKPLDVKLWSPSTPSTRNNWPPMWMTYQALLEQSYREGKKILYEGRKASCSILTTAPTHL